MESGSGIVATSKETELVEAKVHNIYIYIYVCVYRHIYCLQAYNMYVSSAPPFSPSLLFTTHSQVFLSGDDRSDAVSETAEGGLSQRAWNKVKDGGSVFDELEDKHLMSETDSDVADFGQPLKGEDKELYQSLMRMHVNSGHRSINRLCRALVIAGAPRSTVRMARKLKCSICQERKRPAKRRLASLPKARNSGDVVHADLLQVPDASGTKYWILNIVDAASGYQVCTRVHDKTQLCGEEGL